MMYLVLKVLLTFIVFILLVRTIAKMVPTNSRFRSYRIRLVAFILISIFGLVLLVVSYRGLTWSSPSQQNHSTISGFHQTAVDMRQDVRLNKSMSQSDIKPTDDQQLDYTYGIMFDAGSTGSRIHVYKFKLAGGSYQLEDELFLMVKPGLSSYAEQPRKGAESLRDMLNKAAEYIPRRVWRQTPIALKATAGLRLLPNSTAQALLDEVTALFKSYEFQMSPNSVAILDGADEGLFSWFTVNFLNGLLGNVDAMVGVLDLGGGSTQITFVSNNMTAPQGYTLNVNLFGTMYKVYTHSYLGLGMNSGRFQAIGGVETQSSLEAGMFSSVCLPEKYSSSWKYGSKQHKLSALPVISSRFTECHTAVKMLIKKYNIHKPPEVINKTFYAMSYYVDRATDSKLIDEKEGGMLKVRQFYDAAQTECNKVSADDPFRCLDLCYISALLTDGFGFHNNTLLVLKKKIRAIEIAWPLGALFDVYGKFNKKPT